MTEVNENTALLGTSPTKSRFRLKAKTRKIMIATFVLFALAALLFQISDSSTVPHTKPKSDNKKNVIFFVTDGMGPASLSLARSFRQYKYDLPMNDTLFLDHYLIGSSRTRSSDSLVTDSAAGATAFSCALKSYNGAIGVDPFNAPCGTILEGAKLNGYMTGLVVTTRITDATPASFSAHADFRIQEDLIALHQLGNYPLGRMVDLMIGGGRTHYYSGKSRYGPSGTRKDNRNLIDEAINNGWQYVGSRSEFDSLKLGHNVSLPLLGLLADYDIPFDLDRSHSKYPSLEEQTITALNALSAATKNSDKGFFLLVEGSRIDHAGHQNDPAAQVREVLAFDRAFKAAVEFAENSDVETILISTSDHETGGLVTARQVTDDYPEYLWYPQVLDNAQHSGEYLQMKILNYDGNNKKEFVAKEVLKNDLNITDYTENDLHELVTLADGSKLQEKLNDMVSVRAQVGWTTHGHSAVDVNIYAFANKQETWLDILKNLQGNHENTEIGSFMARYMGIDLVKVTGLINETDHSAGINVKEINRVDLYDKYHHKLLNLRND
ncbi:hypothetical protein KAFR_0E02950 [Kazachstania africana CBS 2517]|uniref:Alkaline phosphatase n=1 Tax=Kazachstania africana (strain ATCC 22294 / BCRC 22015 / CBS 2517 / CECT 1963 / NBRC 1671 / NRRL Y-8276) TaxID=1071382 RepID=H2AVP7_KAZAF|nr:hypothetical protein KAFR_0E02950 [Kazachstania africana CBS 2517]CCF58447.1 hypothetical protein KAFR_0E02950 [Kazachstania africana CBS 2517]